MADDFIDIDGFEDYGAILGGSVTFETYVSTYNTTPNLSSASSERPMLTQSFLSRWLSADNTGGAFSIITGLSGSGRAFVLNGISTSLLAATRSLPGNYSRIKIGFANKVNLSGTTARTGIEFLDNGNVQCGIYFDQAGNVNICSGTFKTASPTSIYQSSSIILNNTRHWFEIDLTIHNTNGAIDLYIDGVQLTSQTSKNTRAGSSNAYINQFRLLNYASTGTAFGGYDDMYWRDNTGGTAPFLGDRTVEGLVVTGDDAVDFTPAASIVGQWYIGQTASTTAPGANQIVLMPVTPAVNKTINSISILPKAVSTTVKFKAVIYSDTGGGPNSLLSSGTETIGAVTDSVLTLPLVTPQALTASTQYWIGFITDTSLAIAVSDAIVSVRQNKANTYASGAPAGGPLSGMTTGQASIVIWGNCTGEAVNYNIVSKNPPAFFFGTGYAYNQSATPGDEDFFTLTDLSSTPTTIDLVKVSVLARRADAGARTMNIKVDSGGTTDSGDNAGITPATTFSWYDTKFTQDPNTSSAWGAAGVNALKVGYEVAS